ncbi:MAG: hypothetical protein DWQ01_02670 [Planctomycetota bacterium]|nr:MAG: hypothetical protein DWQ01_02670 [Planctomycetota bacterium]
MLKTPTLPSATTVERLFAGELPLQPLTPEASTRRYFRPLGDQAEGWLLVRSTQAAPVATTLWLQSLDIPVPALGPEVPGAYLVQDLGDRHLAQQPGEEAYQALLEAGARLHAHPLPENHLQRQFALDVPLFQRELKQFRESYLQAFRKQAWSPEKAEQIDRLCQDLAHAAAAGPWATQHRDFHSRNVLLPAEGGIAILDHQDLRPGPVFYDLASLATDAYVDLPPAVERQIQQAAEELASRCGLGFHEAQKLWQHCALQRVLKALGTFGKLLVEGRSDYAEAEARALRHARRLLADCPEFQALAEWLA